jgi:8-amino-7-oxononanoate synthase
MDSLNTFARKKLAEIKTKGLYRQTRPAARKPGSVVNRDGADYISFSDNDYLGLSQDKRVIQAATEAAEAFGAGAGASRLITGDNPLYAKLEKQIAKFRGTEAACVFPNGYMTNLGVIPVLARDKDLILADRLCHSCVHAGAALSHATLKIFRHNDVDHLEELLERFRGKFNHCLILTDGIFSMDGDRAPVAKMADLARRHDAWLMVDDAHGLGVVEGGKGTCFSGGQRLDVPLQMGTLSKAAGSAGGYIAGDAVVIDLIKNRARTLIYTTGLPPAAVGASLKALEIIAGDKDLCAKPVAKAKLFTRALNLPDPESCIVPIIVGEPTFAMKAYEDLKGEGFLVHPIRPPTVPEGTSRLRFSFSAAHKDEDIERLAEAVRRHGVIK